MNNNNLKDIASKMKEYIDEETIISANSKICNGVSSGFQGSKKVIKDVFHVDEDKEEKINEIHKRFFDYWKYGVMEDEQELAVREVFKFLKTLDIKINI